MIFDGYGEKIIMNNSKIDVANRQAESRISFIINRLILTGISNANFNTNNAKWEGDTTNENKQINK